MSISVSRPNTYGILPSASEGMQRDAAEAFDERLFGDNSHNNSRTDTG
jgi:hypothetical protein